MNTFKVGDKVTVNDTYFSDDGGDDDLELKASIQTAGTVVSTAGLNSVRFDNGAEWDKGQDVWLFASGELDKL